jgi:type IV pilus assembly protein PilA
MGKREQDSGFTLIELLVVIVITGVLAAIAIPLFLNQRQKGYDTQAKNDLRNLANFQEIYLTDKEVYGSIAQIQAAEPTLTLSPGATLSVVKYDSYRGYCLSALSRSGRMFFWDSENGGLQGSGSTGCPVTTSGTDGDSIFKP